MRDIHLTARINVDDTTKEIVLNLGRTSYGGAFTHGDIVLNVIKRSIRKSNRKSIPFSCFASSDGYFHFSIPDEFKGVEYPAGVYDVNIEVNSCFVDKIEILKAPRPYLRSSKTNNSQCSKDEEWVEPSHCQENHHEKEICTINKCDLCVVKKEERVKPSLNLGDQ